MHWIAGRLSALMAALLAAVAGVATSQAASFANAYLQRLGGHIDEARRYLTSLQTGEMGRIVSEPAAREQLLDVFQRRVAELEAARDAIESAGVFTRPIVCLFEFDREIAGATFEQFVPALPLDAPGLVYGLIGIVIGWLLWELLKWPFSRLRRHA